jgi:short-subunit dehydrogenase
MPETALITGASTGIGLELARLFARNRKSLVIVARDDAKLQEVARELMSGGASGVRTIPADLSKPSSPVAICDALRGEPVHYLINNAGFGLGGAFKDTDLQVELDMLQVNIVSLVHLTKLMLPEMVARRHGRIMNVASTAAFQPGPFMAIYYASKAFVLSFTEAIAEELRGSGVTVTALCPGPTASEFQKRAKIQDTALFRRKAMGMMTARKVAEVGYRGMMAGKVVVIPGLLNKTGVQAVRIGPRAIVRRISRKLQEP